MTATAGLCRINFTGSPEKTGCGTSISAYYAIRHSGLNREEDVAVLVVELQTCVESWTEVSKRRDFVDESWLRRWDLP